MSKTRTIGVSAKQYEDEDDCLAAAAEDYVSEHPDAEGWDLSEEELADYLAFAYELGFLLLERSTKEEVSK